MGMNSHSRIGYAGALIAAALLAGGVFISRSILDGFNRIDTENLLGDVGWVMLDLEAKGIELGDFANDLGVLPEAMAFFDQPEVGFMADYLDPMTAEVVEFDFAALFDSRHEYVAGVRYDTGTAGQSDLDREPSRLLAERLGDYELRPGTAKIDLFALGTSLYLVATHLIQNPEERDETPVGVVMVGRRLLVEYEEFEGSIGTTFSLTSRRQDSPWQGNGTRLERDSVYPVFDEEQFFDTEEDLSEWEDLEGSEWEMIEFDVDLGVIEATQYYRLEESALGPDGQPKSVVMCSVGGRFEEAEAVMKVLIPQTISKVAGEKARLVHLALVLGGALTIGFTLFAIREIRRRLGAETSLRTANQQLAEVNAQKDRLFSIIGHDMRAPLNGVIRLSELMARAPDSFASKDVARFANNINLTGKQLHGLLENLLNWARLQTGQLAFDPRPLDLLTVVKQVVSLYRPRAEEKEIEVDVDVPEGMSVKADIEMLKTILRNLVSNAVKFTEQGGTVSISVSEFEGCARISVSDTGCGMSQAVVDALFDLQVNSRTKDAPEEENGSGFGLLLCQEMVRRHEGDLEVYSEVGVGSEFSFALRLV